MRRNQKEEEEIYKKKEINKTKVRQTLDRLKEILKHKKTIACVVVIVILVIIWILCSNYTTFGIVLNKKITSNDIYQALLKDSNNDIFAYKNSVLVYNKRKSYLLR